MNDIATAVAVEPTPAPSSLPHHVFLIDGSGFIFRAYFARAKDPKAERFRTTRGVPTEVVMIFSNMLDKYLRETDADHIAVIFDAEVREKFGVGPDKVIEVQALCGDSTDNVPGVPGIGVKTAAELINTYGDLETLLAHAHEIKQPKRREALVENEAKARLSKELVDRKSVV